MSAGLRRSRRGGSPTAGGSRRSSRRPGSRIATSEPGSAGDGEPDYASVTGTSVAAAAVAAGRRAARAGAARSRRVRAREPPGRLGAAVQALRPRRRPAAPSTRGRRSPERSPRRRRRSGSARGTASAGGSCSGSPFATSRPARSRSRSARAPASSPSSRRRSSSARAESAVVRVTAVATTRPALPIVSGTVTIRPAGVQALRIPWVIVFRPFAGSLLGGVRVDPPSFSPSDAKPGDADRRRRADRGRPDAADRAGGAPRRPPLQRGRQVPRRPREAARPASRRLPLRAHRPRRERRAPPGRGATRSASSRSPSCRGRPAGRRSPSGYSRPAVITIESPFRIAQQQLRNVADVFGDRRRPRRHPRRVQEGGRGLDPDHDGRRLGATSSPAGASPTTSRGAPRRAASATTPASRSTR